MNGRETVADFILRRRRALGLNQGELAEAMRVTRTVVSRWENGQQRPNVALLDDLARVLGDDEGHLASLIRYDGDGDQPPLMDPPMRVGDLLRRIGDALIGFLKTDVAPAGDQPGYGWCRDIDDPSSRPSAWATAFGIRAAGLTGALDHRVNRQQVRDTIRRLELTSGGWSTRATGAAARPEVTAFIAGALQEAGEDEGYVTERVRLAVDLLGRGSDGLRPYVLATSLIELARLGVDDSTGRRLVETLIDLSGSDNHVRWWVMKDRESSMGPRDPATPHTAMSIAAIAAWSRRLDDSGLMAVAREGMRWLEQNADLDLDDEDFWSERRDGGAERLPIRHFTPAWVVRGAMAAGAEVSNAVVDRAMRDMLISYIPAFGVWRWRRSGGVYPIWMTYHGVVALRSWTAAHRLS